MSSTRILLASASPRRKQLLEQLGLSVEQKAADIDESIHEGEADQTYVVRLAQEKAQALVSLVEAVPIIAADTVISLQGEIIGKPRDYAHACDIWQALAGNTHQVLTGVCVYSNGQYSTVLNISEVSFASLTADEMAAYWATGEPHDKAGAYAVQGLAARWIREIRGSYSGIMGLPLYETAQLLQKAGLIQ